jgi:hypothetical protein
MTPYCYDDPMFVYMWLYAQVSRPPFESFGTHLDLGRGVDGDGKFATGFDDPTEPRSDEIRWHVGNVAYRLDVQSGDALSLARSIVANMKVIAPSHRLETAPYIGTVASKVVGSSLLEGVDTLRRKTTVPIEVPAFPAIDPSVRLFAQDGDQNGYWYFLCRTVACKIHEGVVAEVAANRTSAPGNGDPLQNVYLSCGLRGSFRGVDAMNRFALVTWRQGDLDFSVLSASYNPSHTDLVAIARSLISNSCGHRSIKAKKT